MLTKTQMQQATRTQMDIEKQMQNGKYDDYNWEDCPTLARFVNNSKITSRWWERRIANLLGWKTDPKDDNDSQDYGDLFAPPFVIGEDNIELKASEKLGRYDIGGQQFRFYERIPYYMLWKLDPIEDFGRCFLLSKDDLHNEIFEHKSFVPGISQGSGKTAGLSNTQRLQLVEETFNNKNQLLWGVGFNPRTNRDLYERWQSDYMVDIHTLRNWENFKKTKRK